MVAGVDPFQADDPMQVYKNILSGEIHFPFNFDSKAKSLIKHILTADLTKRYGNLKNGSKDISGHRFFEKINFT